MCYGIYNPFQSKMYTQNTYTLIVKDTRILEQSDGLITYFIQ